MLFTAIQIAKMAHVAQLDKAGKPYIDHVFRVMRRVHTEDEMVVAVLHDVLEDSTLTPRDLVDAGIRADLVSAVVTLTRREGERYTEYIRRVGMNPLARVVKLADLEDNLDPSRDGPELDGLRTRYERAKKYLTTI